MGKASRSKKGFHPNEGLVTVSFTFDGITHTNRHQLSASEMKHMKDLCVEFGDLAADQLVWKVAIRGMTMVAENIFAKAALMYIKKHYKGPIVSAETPKDEVIFDPAVHLEGLKEVYENPESNHEITISPTGRIIDPAVENRRLMNTALDQAQAVFNKPPIHHSFGDDFEA